MTRTQKKSTGVFLTIGMGLLGAGAVLGSHSYLEFWGGVVMIVFAVVGFIGALS